MNFTILQKPWVSNFTFVNVSLLLFYVYDYSNILYYFVNSLKL